MLFRRLSVILGGLMPPHRVINLGSGMLVQFLSLDHSLVYEIVEVLVKRRQVIVLVKLRVRI